MGQNYTPLSEKVERCSIQHGRSTVFHVVCCSYTHVHSLQMFSDAQKMWTTTRTVVVHILYACGKELSKEE